jgi:pimeloyl-ACP methyl ester carboxylesterase
VLQTSTTSDFADDVRAQVAYLRSRAEIDPQRIALVGHSEGGLVAMLTAGRQCGKVAALALIATPSASGNEIVLEQQKHMLSKMPIDDAQREEKIALQQKINTAVIKGTGWNDIPLQARRVADTPWFYSFLTFNPEKAMSETRQPVLIVQGELDTQVMPHHADDLAKMARERRGDKVPVELLKVPGVNHLLVPAKTGDVTEYGSLGPDAKISPQVTGAIATFLTKVLKG